MSFSFLSHGQGEVLKHEKEQYRSLLWLQRIQKYFLYSTAVQASRQTVWFNVFLSLTIIRLYRCETLISGVFHHNYRNLELGRIGHARILFFRSAPIIIVSASVTESKII